MGDTLRTAARPQLALHRRTWLVSPAWALAGWGALLGVALFVVARHSMPDDGMISLAFARNLAEQGQWALATGVGVHSATSPLNVWLLAAGIVLTGHAFVAVAVVLAVTLAASAVWLGELGGTSAGVIGPALLATAPVLTSAVGLETYLAVAVLIGLVRYAWARRWAPVAVLVAAAVLARPDMLAAAVAVLAVAAAARRVWWQPAAALVAGGALAGPWFVYSWVRFGSVWPDTLPLKAEQPGWGDGSVRLWNAVPYYLEAWPTATWLTLGALALGALAVPVAVERGQWTAVALVAGGAADLAAMIASNAGPGPYYPGPAVGGALAAAAVVFTRGRRLWPLLAALLLASLVFTVVRWPSWQEGFAPLRANWATNEQYARIVDGLPTDGRVLSSGEIGALAFYCQDRGCTVVDPYLADPGRLRSYVERYRADHPGQVTDLNYRFLRPVEPLPVAYELRFGRELGEGLGRWPITGADRAPRVAVLERAGG